LDWQLYPLAAAKAKQVIALEMNPDNISRINDNLPLNEGIDKIITVLNIGANNKKTVAALDKREGRLMNRVLDMSEGKTDVEDAIRVDTLDHLAANLDINISTW
jgi:hypothetical protein